MKHDSNISTKLLSPTSESGKRVLLREIEGLNALIDILGPAFDEAAQSILNVEGRLIVSGMGKSGHIAKKIAATFASTGTPAFFVHPGEASHGDLGMITKHDILLLLSNSGETAELRDVITYAKRFSVPIIAMVRRQSSMLVEAADISLVLPDIPEATATRAPTTSTTMMIALGDALAVAVLEQRGFSTEDYHTFHPGGKLGTAFIRVKDLMHDLEQTPLVRDNELMSKVLLVMTAKSFGCTGVIDASGTLVGMITDGDLRRHMEASLLTKTAKEVMTPHPKTVTPTMLAAEALGIMNEKSITCLIVEEQSKPLGLLHVHDCLRAGIL